MFEVIRDSMIWLMSWVIGRRPEGGEAFRLLFLLIFTGAATWLTVYWRDLAYRSPTIRRRLLPSDRYAGRYLQAVLHGVEVRYTIVHIFFCSPKKRYEVTGRTYATDGSFLSAFKSFYILFPSDKDDNIEFIWQGRQSQSANSFGGYTKMTVEASDEDYIQGTGLIMAFGDEPKVYALKFKHLDEGHVRSAVGASAPTQSGDEPAFIEKFHAMFGAAVKGGLQRDAAREQSQAVTA